MKKIKTAPQKIAMITNGEYSIVDSLGELGIFTVYLSDIDQVYYNSIAGTLIRIKKAGFNEGGVAVGISSVGSILLV